MNTRRLGNSSLQVTPLCFGGNVFGWTIEEAASFRMLDALADAGLNFIDTADVYSRWKPGNQGGESETIIGKWLKQRGKRESLVIATKVGMDMGGGKKGLSKPISWSRWTTRCGACRRTISIFISRTWTIGDTSGRNVERLRAIDQERQGASDRRLQLFGTAASAGAGVE